MNFSREKGLGDAFCALTVGMRENKKGSKRGDGSWTVQSHIISNRTYVKRDPLIGAFDRALPSFCVSPWQPRKGVPPLVPTVDNNLVTQSGHDWFCFNVTCFELVAQPLISFTFSGGLRLFGFFVVIFKLNFRF